MSETVWGWGGAGNFHGENDLKNQGMKRGTPDKLQMEWFRNKIMIQNNVDVGLMKKKSSMPETSPNRKLGYQMPSKIRPKTNPNWWL